MMRCACLLALLALIAPAVERPSTETTDQRIAKLERRLKWSPKDHAVRNELAGAFLQKMRETADGSYLDRASALVGLILADDPTNYEARRRLVEIQMQKHKFAEAAALAEALLKDRSDDSTLWGLLGDAQMERGDYERAADAYQIMVDLRPGLPSYARVSFYRFVTGDAAGAIEAMRQAVAVGGPPEYVAWCLSDLGNMLMKTGAVASADAEYKKALELVPGYHRALAGMGRVLASKGRNEEAARVFLDAQTRAPYPEYAAELVKLYRTLGRPDQARKQLRMLDVIDRLGKAAGETANRSLALALADLEHRPARALELALSELEVRRDVYTHDALAWALFRNGKTAEAAESIRNALALNTPEPSFHEHAATIFEALGDGAEARRHRARAAALSAARNP